MSVADPSGIAVRWQQAPTSYSSRGNMNVVAESVLARKANRLISEIAAIRSTKKVLKASVSSLIAEGSDNGIVEPKMQWQAIVTAASNNHLSLPLLRWPRIGDTPWP